MKKLSVGGYEIRIEGLVMGAMATVGIGLVGLGIKSFFDARKLRYIELQPVDEEEEFEEYKRKKALKLKRARARKIRKGVVGTVVGSFAAAAGIIAFTPLKDDIKDTLRESISEDVKESIRETLNAENIKSNIGDKVSAVKDLDISDSVQKLKSAAESLQKLKIDSILPM